jgi:O-antigen ligase
VTASLGLALAFAGWTVLVNDSFWLRLTGAQGDFSSGRWASIAHWLALAGDHPWGMGLGAVRELLAEGRPALGADAYLEWPHNEFVRLYVEAGPPGLVFVALLLVVLVRRALRAARDLADPVLRALILAIAADLVAEACLQNLLNAVYHATVLILILSLAVAAVRRPWPLASHASPMPLAPPLASR